MTYAEQSDTLPASSGQAFEKVVLLTDQPSGIGTLAAYPGRLEFESKQLRVTLPDVREIAFEYEKVQPGALQRTARVRVTYYIVAWGAMVFGALSFIAGALDYRSGRKAKEAAETDSDRELP